MTDTETRPINWRNEIPTDMPGKEHGVDYLMIETLYQAFKRRLINEMGQQIQSSMDNVRKTTRSSDSQTS